MTITVTRVLSTSKSRPTQMRVLANALTDRYGVRFEARYNDRQWRMEWPDGPTHDEVRAAVTRLAVGLDAVDTMTLDRCNTDLGHAVALLMWIDTDPSQLAQLSSWQIAEAYAVTRYPERAPTVWIARGKALLELGYLPTTGIESLRLCTWPEALACLDEVAAESAA